MKSSGPPQTVLLAADAQGDLSASDSRLLMSVPSAERYLPGEVIADRYRLIRELGRGGMGVVWVAHSLVLDVDVALKLIKANSENREVESRMPREARTAARLCHPALVRVFDFGWTTRRDPFLVMELVTGETLSKRLEREKRISPIRAVQIILPLADGLRVAHEKHIVHRDIKPDNIFLATDTLGRVQPKLIDFGIAKVEPHEQDPKITQVGVILGSPEYMSPEQSRGMDDVDARTDVWSLSVVLYELVTGTIPFSKPNYNALMQSIIHDEPKSFLEHAAGDADLWAIVLRGLAKDREQRWSGMTAFGEALARWLHALGVKEDLSGNSIRAVWLDSSVGPRGQTLSAARTSPSTWPALPNEAMESARTSPLQPALTLPEAPKPQNRRRRGVALLAIGAALGVAASLSLGIRREGARSPTSLSPLPLPLLPSIAGSTSADSISPGADGVPFPFPSTVEAPMTEIRREASDLVRASAVASGEGQGSAQAAPSSVPDKHPTKGPAAAPKGKRATSKPRHDFGF